MNLFNDIFDPIVLMVYCLACLQIIGVILSVCLLSVLGYLVYRRFR